MTPYKNKNLIEGLRETLENVERTSGIQADDPALAELRSILNRRVAALERSLLTEFAAGVDQSEKDYGHEYHTSESSMRQ
jgi:hypothetical protein